MKLLNKSVEKSYQAERRYENIKFWLLNNEKPITQVEDDMFDLVESLDHSTYFTFSEAFRSSMDEFRGLYPICISLESGIFAVREGVKF